MTIVFSAKRERFGLVAADRMHKVTHPCGKTTCWGAEKIVYHREHPLACAIAGLVELPASTSAQAKVTEVLDTITSTRELDGRLIAEKLDASVGPLITGNNFLKAWILLLEDGKPSITWCQIPTTPLDVDVKGQLQWNCTNDLLGFYQAKPVLFTALHDDSVQDWAVVCQYAINAVSEGIQEEARRNGGQNVECGLGIDIAIVASAFGLRRCQVPQNQFPPAKYPAP